MSLSDFMNLLEAEPEKKSVAKKLGYVLDPEVVTLSFSRRATLNSCPRKFLLKELHQQSQRFSSIDTAYGSAFGAGVQELFRSGDIERAWIAALAEWDFEEYELSSGKKKDKSLWSCMASLEAFYNTKFQELCLEYELAYIEGKPGIELFVYLSAGDSYSYQVHIDLILQNKETGALVVVEIKTSGMQHLEAHWGNSEQTLGYYAILEFISNKYGIPFEPRIIYITQTTGKYLSYEEDFGFSTFVFEKGPGTSLDFARNVLLDIETIELYIKHSYFPKRGTACVNFGKACEFYGLCDLESMQRGEGGSNEIYESLTMDDVDFTFDLGDLIQSIEI